MCSGAFELDQCYGVMIDIVACHFAKMMVMGEHNIVEQDHRAVKRITKPMPGFKSYLVKIQPAQTCLFDHF